MVVTSEVYLAKKFISPEEWLLFLQTISHYNGIFRKWKMIVVNENHQIRYLIETKRHLPPTINHLDSFFFKEVNDSPSFSSKCSSLEFVKLNRSFIDLINACEVGRKGDLFRLEIQIHNLGNNHFLSRSWYFVRNNGRVQKRYLFFPLPQFLLAVDFSSLNRFFYKKLPKYLEIQKALPLLCTNSNQALFEVDSFPYFQEKMYLSQNAFPFAKHSLIIGSSGFGKSKMISLFVANLYRDFELRKQYKVVVIDPHASLERDIGGIGRVIDFETLDDSVDLFFNHRDSVVSTTELLLDLFRSLFQDQYQSKMERVLRHSIYLLLCAECFSFSNLRHLLLDTEYRNQLLQNYKQYIPHSIASFFGSDFNDLKTKSYGEAISPIISFLDEMTMLPVFQGERSSYHLESTIQNHFLTIFSLNQNKLGNRITKVLAGLIMQQMFSLIQRGAISEQILFIVDEVPVIENPILTRFLAESRKYHLSCILSGQYFSQISESLKRAIFANVVHYYIFRVSQMDASALVDCVSMKLSSSDTKEAKIQFLTELNQRECVVRISNQNVMIPAFKGRTCNFESIPRMKKKEIVPDTEVIQKKVKPFSFELGTVDLKTVLKQNSTNKRGVFHD